MAEAKKAPKKKTKAEERAQLDAILAAESALVAEKAKEIVDEKVAEEKQPKTDAKPLAKAGKRSAKAVAEVEEKQVKAERKADAKTTDAKPKSTKKPTRPKHERAGKKYREVYKLIDQNRVYPLKDALELVVKTSTTKFDSSVELHVNLGVDPKQADQNVRATVSLPAGTGKTLRVAAFVEGDDIKAAKSAGAEIAGADEITAALDKENMDFDVLVATPTLMAKLGKYARLLGPRGLMPNPKSGTVTTDVAKAVTEAKAGKVEYRVDEAGIIHLAIGKVSFGAPKLEQNAGAVLSSINASKPSSLKGIYVKSAHLTTTMGPGIKITV